MSPHSKGSTIYVVIGSCGEYSDRSEWLVRAFHTKAAAEAHVLRASVFAQEVHAAKVSEYGPQGAAAKKRAADAGIDPGFEFEGGDYAHATTYYMEEVELDGEPPSTSEDCSMASLIPEANRRRIAECLIANFENDNRAREALNKRNCREAKGPDEPCK